MIIQFKKNRSKPSVLNCIRKDGTNTWTKIQNEFEIHDLAHYAVETVLGFDNAFYGLLAKGFSIQDFELPKDQRPEALVPSNLPQQALQTEHIVNLLTTVTVSPEHSGFEFIHELKVILEESNLDFPDNLTPKSLEDIFTCFYDLNAKWKSLEEGGILELMF